MVGVANVAAKGEPSAREILAEADVQVIAVIRMHIEVRVFAGTIRDNERTVIVENRRLAREGACQRVHADPDRVQARPQADIVQDEAIPFMESAPRLEATLAEILDLLDEPPDAAAVSRERVTSRSCATAPARPVARHRRRQRGILAP